MRQHGTTLALVVAAAAIVILAPANVDAAIRKDNDNTSTTATRQLRGQNRFSTRAGNQAATDEDVLALEDLAYWDRYLKEKKGGSIPPSPGPGPTPSPGPTGEWSAVIFHLNPIFRLGAYLFFALVYTPSSLNKSVPSHHLFIFISQIIPIPSLQWTYGKTKAAPHPR